MIMDEKRDDDGNRYIIKLSRKSFYDLSHLIYQGMPIYPGNPHPQFQPFYTLEKDKANVTRLTLGSHTGTHVDAPKHFILNGGIIEGLNSNLKKCLNKRMFLVCLPLFLKGIDGAPARVIAFDIA